MVRHDRCERAAVWPFALLYCCYDLFWRPIADPGFFIGRDVASGKGTKTWDFECDF